MKTGIGVCCVTKECAQSIFIIVTIDVIIITNTITTTIQASLCCKWLVFLSHRGSIHVTEQACCNKSTNPDIPKF